MAFLTLKIDGTTRNNIVEDIVYSNSLVGNPTIDINPSDVDNSEFDIGNVIQIYDGATKLLSGSIKDITEIDFLGINTKSSRIHIRDLKEKIFSADLTPYTGMTNLQALTYLCSQASVTLSTSVTTTTKYAMDKEIQSKSFWKIVQDICASEGWGCYVNEDTLFVVDVLNNSSSYTLTGIEQLEHTYNDLNVFGNIAMKGIINKDRLISDDNPYSSILSYNNLSSLDTFNITVDNKNDFLSILQADAGVENFILNENGTFTFDLINATTLSETYDYNTFTITSSNTNIEILNLQKILYNENDNVAEQCGILRMTCDIKSEESEVIFINDLQGKTIASHTVDLTPDTFTAVYKDNDANEISKNRYLYYENKNITSVGQMQKIVSSLARETSNRILKLNVKIKSDHVFSLLERVYIENVGDNFDGYWSVYSFSCRRNVRLQEWSLELVRSNTIIIPELNIYSKNNIGLQSYIDKTFKGMIIEELKENANDNLNLNSENSVKCFIPELRIKVEAFNKSNFNVNRGQVCYLKKMPFSDIWVILSVDTKDLKSNTERIQYFEGNSDSIANFTGGWESGLETTWEASGINTTPTTEPYNYTETNLTISSYTVTYLGEVGYYKIALTLNKDVNPATVNSTSFIVI